MNTKYKTFMYEKLNFLIVIVKTFNDTMVFFYCCCSVVFRMAQRNIFYFNVVVIEVRIRSRTLNITSYKVEEQTLKLFHS